MFYFFQMDNMEPMNLFVTNFVEEQMKSGYFDDKVPIGIEITTKDLETVYEITPSENRQDLFKHNIELHVKFKITPLNLR